MANVSDGHNPSTPKFVILPKNLHKEVSPTAYQVYGAFASYVNNQTRQTVVKMETVAADLSVTLKTVERALRELSKLGYVKTRSRGYKQSSVRTFKLAPKMKDDTTNEALKSVDDPDSDVVTSLDSTENYTLEPGDDPIAETFGDYETTQPVESFHTNVPAVTGWMFAYRPGGFFRKAA